MKPSSILVSNDDGPNSPLFVPLLDALAELSWCKKLRFAIPDSEKSWGSQAISRKRDVKVVPTTINSHVGHLVDGTPADCVNIALTHLEKSNVDLVVSGINVGMNAGFAFCSYSGTLAAARAAAIAGLPAVALSLRAPPEISNLWHQGDYSFIEPLRERWMEVAQIAVATVDSLINDNFPSNVDFFSVNLPWEVKQNTEMVFTHIEHYRLNPIFAPVDENIYRFTYNGIVPPESTGKHVSGMPGDVSTIENGKISVSAISHCFEAILPV